METILIVEDDHAVQKALKRLFRSAGYSVDISGDGMSALEVFRASTPTAIVLDLRLPLLSGQDVCLHIKRHQPALPIIILSASTDIVDKVLLLELGADDYVTKPFSPRELLARVRAAIRSTHKPIIHDEQFDGICVDFAKMQVIRKGQPITLTASEFKILKFFLRNKKRDVSREELVREALGHSDCISLRNVDNYILKLRQKLETDPENPIHFLTTYRAGYRFVR
jgi:DNA-binding response OmpR family regulator